MQNALKSCALVVTYTTLALTVIGIFANWPNGIVLTTWAMSVSFSVAGMAVTLIGDETPQERDWRQREHAHQRREAEEEWRNMTPEERAKAEATEYLLAGIGATSVATCLALLAMYFMREHRLVLLIPPIATLALLLHGKMRATRTRIRTGGAALALVVFNGLIILGGGLTLPDSYPRDETMISTAILAKTVPVAVTVALNCLMAFAWNQSRKTARTAQRDVAAATPTINPASQPRKAKQ